MLLEESKNRSLKNCPFEEKLKVYSKGRLLQQKEIEGFATVKGEDQLVWDKAAIERRHNAILAAAMEVWDLGKV